MKYGRGLIWRRSNRDELRSGRKEARRCDGAALTGVAAALVAVVFWSTNAVAAKFALAEFGVVQALALQFGGATAALAAVQALRSVGAGGCGAAIRWAFPYSPGILGSVMVGVVGLAGTIFLQYLAFATAPIVEANVISYGWPLFAALWAAFVYRSRQTLAGAPLAMAGFAGVAIMLGAGGGFGSTGGTAGYVAALASALCMTFYTVMSGRLRVSAGTVLLPATAIGMISALMICITGLAPWSWASADPGAWVASVYAGVGPMAGGFLLWSRAMSGDGAKRLAPLGYATPLLSTVLLLLFREALTPGALIGAALVIACSVGVLMVNGKELG